MEIKVLEYFLRVAELGSINRASEELRLSQPSLSRWISILEREIGTPLLIRSRRGVQITDAGRTLVERSGPILRELHSLFDEAANRAQMQAALGMPIAMARLVTAPFVSSIAQTHKNLGLRVYDGSNNAIRRWMESGQVDVGIIALSDRIPERFDTIPVIKEQLFLVGDHQAALRLDAPVSVTRLASLNLIMPGRPNVMRAQIENILRRRGKSYQGYIDAESGSLCLELARRGVGYTILPYCAFSDQWSEPTDFTAAPIESVTLTWALQVNRARDESIAVHTIGRQLREFMSKLIMGGKWQFAEFLSK